MDTTAEQIQTFIPTHTSEWSTFYIALVVALIGLVLTIYFIKKPAASRARNMNMLIAMLTFFACIISSGTAFFSWLTVQKVSPVIISTETVETGYGTTEIGKISRLYFHNDVQKTLLNSSVQKGSTRFLIIEEIGGKTHALSEEHYNLGEIYKNLKEKMPK